MKEHSIKARIDIVQGDITTLAVDAIVNAANAGLLGGGGVDGAIHRAAGPELLEACRPLGGCPTGEVRVTPGFDLPARYVFHGVGPIWQGGHRGEPELLAGCYRHALQLAQENQLSSLAFPAISCGVYGYPHAEAVKMALDVVTAWMKHHRWPEKVVFVLFSPEMAALYESRLAEVVK